MRICTIVLLLVALVLPLAAQDVSVVQSSVKYAGSMYYFHQRKAARTTTGTLMVAWQNGTGAGNQVSCSTYDPSFQTWSPAVAISSAPGVGLAIQPALAADEQGNIHATWQQRATSSSKYQIYYCKYNGTVWGTPKKISIVDTLAAEEATIDVDSRGWLWVVYNNDGAGAGKEYLFALRSTDGGSTWSTTPDTLSKGGTLGSSIEVARAAIAPGPSGKLVVAWDNSLTGTLARREVFVNQFDGSAWSGEVRVSDTTSVDRDHNRYVAACVDQQSNIYLFYTLPIVSGSDPRLSYLVMHKKAWGSSWTPGYTLALDSNAANYLSVSSVVDSGGVIHLAHRRDVASDTTGLDEIVYRYSKDQGTTWSAPVRLSRAQYDGGYVSLGNRVRRAYGIDAAWRESHDAMRLDQDTTDVLYGNIPYSFVTSVEPAGVPVQFEMLANYPNPFNPSTVIRFDVAMKGRVSLVVYDLLGREVRVLLNEEREAGSHEVRWDGRTRSEATAPTGVYIARLTTASGMRTHAMLLMK